MAESCNQETSITQIIMVIRELEDLETFHANDIRNSQLNIKDSTFSAEEFGYAIILITFVLIVLLVCLVGITITSPCCCHGNQVNLLSLNYLQRESSCVLNIVNSNCNKEENDQELQTSNLQKHAS